MIANYFTRPLKESLFRKMRDIIMGLVNFLDEKCAGLREKVTKISSVQNKEPRIESQSYIKYMNVGLIDGWAKNVNRMVNQWLAG